MIGTSALAIERQGSLRKYPYVLLPRIHGPAPDAFFLSGAAACSAELK